jgi:hypothetical protein
VDPELSDAYASLSRRKGLGVLSGTNVDSEPLLEAELFAVRQITHEVLRTLDPPYRKRPDLPNEAVINVRMTFTPKVGD